MKKNLIYFAIILLNASLQSSQIQRTVIYNKDLGPWRGLKGSEPALYHEGSSLQTFLNSNELCPNLDNNGSWVTSDLFTEAEKASRENQKPQRDGQKDWQFIYRIKAAGLIAIKFADKGTLYLEKEAFVNLIYKAQPINHTAIKQALKHGSYKGLIFIDTLSAQLYNNEYVVTGFEGSEIAGGFDNENKYLEMPLSNVFQGINYLYLNNHLVDCFFDEKNNQALTKKRLEDLKSKKELEKKLQMEKELQKRETEKEEYEKETKGWEF